MTLCWVEPDIRDEVVDHVLHLKAESHLTICEITKFLNITRTKYYDWRDRYGQINNHNGKIPKKHWSTPDEIKAIEDYARSKIPTGTYYLKEGYRRLTYQMLDANIVAVSPSTVYRVLS